MTFKELKLTQPLLMALENIGYKNPTPIQEKAITPIIGVEFYKL